MLDRLSPRQRWWAMQGVLWGVLLVTLGLAAWVREYRVRRLRIELEGQKEMGEFRVCRPKGWTERYAAEGITLEEPGARNEGGRRLEIRGARAGSFISPLEYLVRLGEVHEDAGAVKRIAIAGWPGVLVSQSRLERVGGTGRETPRKQVVACTVTPWGQVIVLRLEGAGVADAGDESLVRAVGESLGVLDQPALDGSSELELAGNIRVKTPRGLATCAVEDRFRTERVLVARASSGWLGVAVVPCVVLEDDPGEALASMLSLRDPAWHGAAGWKVSEDLWVCEKRSQDGFPAIAYLRTDGRGMGVLAEFRWNRLAHKATPDPSQVQVMGEQLMAGLRFAGEGPVRNLVRSGVAALRPLSGDVGALVDAEKPLNEEWEWYDEALPRVTRMTVHCHVDAKSLWGAWEADRSPPLGTSGREVCQWRLARDSSSYDHSLRREGASAMVSQESHLANGRLNTVVRQGNDEVAQASGVVPEAYVPGGLLPLVIGHLPYEPMILRTESILMAGNSASARPMVLVLDPDFDLPKVPPGQDEAMRCWRVQVSGSGQVSRWYVDGEGRMDSIDFADGVHLHRGE